MRNPTDRWPISDRSRRKRRARRSEQASNPSLEPCPLAKLAVTGDTRVESNYWNSMSEIWLRVFSHQMTVKTATEGRLTRTERLNRNRYCLQRHACLFNGPVAEQTKAVKPCAYGKRR